ncbi:MAG TPA: hypothetical protein VF596_03380 [Pyrinomonadaceae bacterium]|jgi:hypothetical protein
MWSAIKNVILWNYGRTAWQYDVLCILILAFIFLTPKSWFEGKQRQPLAAAAESSKITRLIVSAEDFSPDLDENARLQRVRELSGNKDAEILNYRQKADKNGKTIYEIELR